MIPVNEPLISGNELKYVTDCVESAWISSAGKYIDIFEKKWASYCGKEHGIAVANGTTALEAAVYALDLPESSEIIMPSFTIISCAIAMIRNGMVPVLVDVEEDTWTIDPSKIEEKITEKTKAIMVVHMYGHPCNMREISDIASKYGLKIIEDAAEVHGAECYGRKCGSWGDVSCFSFYANKIITTGEGGMVLTDDPGMAERARSYRNLCFIKEKRFLHYELGNNYRMTNVQAAIGAAQVEQIERFLEIKINMGKFYSEGLSGISGIQLPVQKDWATNVYWMYGIVLSLEIGMNAEEFAEKLLAEGVETRPFFLGMHQQPVFNKMGLFIDETYPVTENLSSHGLYLPSGMALTEEQMRQTIGAIKKILKS